MIDRHDGLYIQQTKKLCNVKSTKSRAVGCKGFILNRFDNVVFEGAQGLLLDQNNSDYFPHVTSSNTGIKNVMDILTSLKYKGKVDIYYMSRCYLTRHGAGPFPEESSTFASDYKLFDKTNIYNP